MVPTLAAAVRRAGSIEHMLLKLKAPAPPDAVVRDARAALSAAVAANVAA
eukprot:gene41292-4500_t